MQDPDTQIPNRVKKKDPDFRLINAKEVVVAWYNKKIADPMFLAETSITMDDVYIVWFNKTLQNWKALLSTDVADTRYYELTYNGDKDQIYLDVYQKEANECINTIKIGDE